MSSMFWVKRVGLGLFPDGNESVTELEKLPRGKSLQVEIRQPRNLQRHKLYWAVCHRIANAIGAEPENVSDVLKIASGHFTLVKTQSYGDIKLPKSIAFHNLDETGFKSFMDRCFAIIETEWCIARSDLKDAIKDLIKEAKT